MIRRISSTCVSNIVVTIALAAGLIAMWWAYSMFGEVMYRKDFLHARTMVHLAALKQYTSIHGEFPPPPMSAKSRSEFLSYARSTTDPRAKTAIDPEYVCLLLDEHGSWFAKSVIARKSQPPVFVQLSQGVPGGSVVIMRRDGPYLLTDGRESQLSLVGELLTLYSYSDMSIPRDLTRAEVSEFVYRLAEDRTVPVEQKSTTESAGSVPSTLTEESH